MKLHAIQKAGVCPNHRFVQFADEGSSIMDLFTLAPVTAQCYMEEPILPKLQEVNIPEDGWSQPSLLAETIDITLLAKKLKCFNQFAYYF